MDNATPPRARLSHRLHRDYLKPGAHSLVIPVPDDIAALIGIIVVQWGAFEARMDALTETIFERMRKTPPANWKRLGFSKRKVIFRDTLEAYVKIMFPFEGGTFRVIAERAAGLQWQRNVVAHGYVSMDFSEEEVSEGLREIIFTARGVHKGRDVTIPLNVPTLEKLRHEIGHLGGDLMVAISRMGGRIENASPEIVIPNSDFLEEGESGNFRFLRIQDPSPFD